ncbi:gamma-glutamyltransferase [Allosphingosinicella flava]|uniref:Glutathione hydrolase proenzyme n=1 Tax=Allosphingosinicella flava TaxID=2771430 RepID=A0A7T2LN76_9SPHN|nr:gamma-glutamyltransferase [Sphingosinicella flava]QPQ56334.1 gamma-glutamyltransferase [Sphingosinicella flava]
MLNRFLLLFALFVMPVATSAQGVVSSADSRATAAGQQILRDGGSAADAAMAMMLALTVVEPQSSGIGGGGFLIHHDAATGRTQTIDGREKAPAAATPERFLGADGKPRPFMQVVPGGLSVGVPGNIALMAQTHAKWGRLPWARLFDPAIKLAEDGFAVSKSTAGYLAMVAPTWKDFPESQAIYWRDGKPLAAGETVRNPALAATLRRIAAEGPDGFYKGPVADAIVNAVQGSKRNAADMTRADLAAYEAKERPPVCMAYRAYKVCGMGPPSSGATTVLGILGMLERFDMKAMGKDDPRAWHLIAEAMKLAYADRDTWVGDRDFVDVPVAGLIDKAYLAKRSAGISPARPLGRYEAGMPPGAAPRTAAMSGEVPSTTHFVAVDGRGNVASMTSTVEGIFGSQLVAGGFILNNELTDFSFAPEKDGAPVANRVEANKRPRSSMSPTIVYDASGKPVLALGSAGGPRIIMHVAKTLIGWIDFGLPVAEAIALPNIYFGGDATLVEKGTFLAAMQGEMTRYDGLVTASDLGSKVNAVEYVDGAWRGAADPRSEGNALAE